MGTINSRITTNSTTVDDRHPILDCDYDVPEYFGSWSYQRRGTAHSFNSGLYCSYKARLLNEIGRPVSNGKLQLTYNELLYRYAERNEIKTVRWPLAGLRGYGYCEHLFTFEAGRRCAMCKCIKCIIC